MTMNVASSDDVSVDDVLRGIDGEHWYGDGPPIWRHGRNDRPAVTSEEAFRSRGERWRTAPSPGAIRDCGHCSRDKRWNLPSRST